MTKNICVIDGHPDPAKSRFVHALCDAYCDGAVAADHTVSRIDIASHLFSPLASKAEFETNPDTFVMRERAKLTAAEHVVLMFPLWMGSMPSATRAFFEQAARGNFFLDTIDDAGAWPRRMMKGKSARVVVTMGMPALVYKTVFGSAALKAIERGLFGISGFKPVRHTIFGGVDNATTKKTEFWLSEVRSLGYRGL